MPLEDLPTTPTIDTVMGEAELAREDLLGAIRQVMFAASTEATRFYLNGVCLHDEGAQLVAVATDGHRLAKCRIPAAPFSQDLSCIVPLATIGPLIKLLASRRPSAGEAAAIEDPDRDHRAGLRPHVKADRRHLSRLRAPYSGSRRRIARPSIATISSPRWRGSPP